MPEFPDWLRGLALIGKAGTEYVVIKVKSTGELYTLIQGEFGGTPTTIAVDTDGNMLAVLKGQFGGVPTTVRVDADGRLYSYMTDDIDQWGNILPGGFAELAARLGSLQAYERRGQVVFTDSFEFGRSAWSGGGDAGYTCELDPTVSKHGGYSVHLKTHSDDGDALTFRTDSGGYPADVGVGIAFWAMLPGMGTEFRFAVEVADAAGANVGAITLRVADSKLLYLNSDGDDEQFGTWHAAIYDPDVFRFLKVAIDTKAGEYLYAVVDGAQFDLRGIACWPTTMPGRRVNGEFKLVGSATVPAEAYIDSYVFTTRETGYQIT